MLIRPLLVLGLGGVSLAQARVTLEALPGVATRGGKGAESISVQQASARAAVANSRAGTIEVFDLSRPEAPRALFAHELRLAKGEELTCVAFHPQHDWFAAAIKAAGPLDPGHLAIVDASSGRELARLAAGTGPDHVQFEPGGRWALVANEGEGYAVEGGTPRAALGSLTLVTVGAEGAPFLTQQIALPSAGAVAGMTQPSDGRFLERKAGKEKLSIPVGPAIDLLEPEVVAFTPDGLQAFVSLQENNGVARIDVASAKVLGFFGLQTTRHLADVVNDGTIALDKELVALREPDGIAVTPDAKYLVTADEGDTDPKASRRLPDKPAGGGRTVSVFDAASGALLGDTGEQLDRRCVEAGLYSDDRSDNKGCEPEMIACFANAGRSFAVVTLERADAIALIALEDPARPTVLGVSALGPGGPHAPEGIAVQAARDGAVYVYSANEESGFLGVVRVRF